MTRDQLLTAPDTALPTLRGAVAGLPPYVPGRRSAGVDIAALASNESHYEPLPAAAAAVAAAAGTMNRYPDSAAVELRERLARHLGVTAGEVAVGPGSVGVLQQIITGLCDAGDEVIFAWRSFEAYPILVELAGARPVRIPLDDAEGHDLDAMAAAVTDRTKVILLCTPNNPTGVPISHERIEAFLQSVRSDILVVIDEAYVEYAEAGSGPDSLALYRRVPERLHPAHLLEGLRTRRPARGIRRGGAGHRRGTAPDRPSLLRERAGPEGGHRVAGRGGGDGSAGGRRQAGARTDGRAAGSPGLETAAEPGQFPVDPCG